MYGKAGFLIVSLTFLLTGCGSTQHPTASNIPSVNAVVPNTLVVVRHNPLHQPGIQPLTKTISDGRVIKELYTDLSRLKSLPTGSMSCPNDNGVSYTLTFKHNNSVVLVAKAKDTGCRIIHLSKGTPKTRWAMSKDGKSFWSLLYRSLGLPTKS